MKNPILLSIALCCLCIISTTHVFAQQGATGVSTLPAQLDNTVPVTWENFVRAETDKTFKTNVGYVGIGKFLHLRTLTSIDKQDVIRMNRDTRYSMGIFDLTSPLTVTLPDTKGRFISMQVINQDHYTKSVEYTPGEYVFTREEMGTRYICLVIRILVNGDDPKDNSVVTDLQNSIRIEQASPGKFETPNWDQPSQDKLREGIKMLGSTATSSKLFFGDVDEVNPIGHLIGAATGWGGNPAYAAIYLGVSPEKNDGQTPYKLKVKDVPVDGFWSVSVYNKDGYYEKNPYNAYTINNSTGVKDKDGSVTIHFGGDPKQPNFLPITEGWNYTVRLYRARKEILDGSWTFPSPVQVK
ncbi:MAG: DUF1214 domain-containing protein [Saprospiraceae bacterium]